MKILALETGQKSCSVALLENEKLLAEMTDNRGLTHSRTVMRMVESVFAENGWSAKEIGLYAVTVGPGSFTGLRIGISAVKGLCMGDSTPVAAVSSLAALALGANRDGFVAPIMDARQGRVFCALFKKEGDQLERLLSDELLPIPDFLEKIIKICPKNSVYPIGDGANLCYNNSNKAETALLAPDSTSADPLRGVSVGRIGLRLWQEGIFTDAEKLAPIYFQKPKAERMLEEAAQAN